MKVLLFLNGPEGWQTGIEDGFSHLHVTGVIDEVKWFYLDDYLKKKGMVEGLSKAIEIAETFQPDMIVTFHIGKLPITDKFILTLKNMIQNRK